MSEKKRHIQNATEARIMALFLANERNRHIRDIRNIERDLDKLKRKWGVEVPRDYEQWTEI